MPNLTIKIEWSSSPKKQVKQYRAWLDAAIAVPAIVGFMSLAYGWMTGDQSLAHDFIKLLIDLLRRTG